MDGFWRDVRHALRCFRRSPGLVIVASLSLALGIASNVTIFAATNRLIWHPLPYRQPEQLVQLWATDSTRGQSNLTFSVPDFLDWRRQLQSAAIAGYTETSFNYAEGDSPERLFALRTSAEFFTVLKVRPAVGRSFRPTDEAPGGERVALLSDRFWTRRYGSDSAVVGRSILLDGEPYQVIGVLASDFRWGGNPADIYVPLLAEPDGARGDHRLFAIGRLTDGATRARAEAEARQIASRLAAAYPSTDGGLSARVMPMEGPLNGDTPRQAATITLFAVGCVLLIACANVANLLLARATGRERELAVRSALGAGRGRLIRELLTESLVLAGIGGSLGLLLSFAGMQWFRSIIPASMPGHDTLAIDWAAFAFATAVSIGSGIIFGIAPALRSARPNLAAALRDGGRGLTGLRHSTMLAGLVGVEIALALVLLISAALLIKGSIAVQSVDPGFDLTSALTFRTALSEKEYPDSLAVVRFQEQLRDRLAATSNVVAVGGVSSLPMGGGSGGWYLIEGEPEPEQGRAGPITQVRGVTPGYLQAIGIALKAGRDLTSADRFEAPRVAIINETLARRHWKDRSPLGRRIRVYGEWRSIVGVVQDTREFGVDDPAPPVVLLPATQSISRRLTFVLKTNGSPLSLVPAVRDQVRALAANQPIYDVRSLAAYIGESQRQLAVMPQLLTVFGVMALCLAVIGVYGVIAYAVAQRTQEMGVRRALGAGSRNITSLVLRGAMTVCGAGAVVGLLLAALATRGLASFLYGVNAFDPVVFGGVTAMLLGSAFIAALVPARRATRVDPIIALRSD